jgi:hypothetical protein
MNTREYHLFHWRDGFFLAQYGNPAQGPFGVSAGNRASASALGFKNYPRGPYSRPEDSHLPNTQRRLDYFVDFFCHPLTRKIATESTFYKLLRWRGLPVHIQDWCDPPPHGRRLNINMYPDTWPSFVQRDQRIAGLTSLEGIPSHELNSPEIGWYALVPMLRREGWEIMDEYVMGRMAKKMCMIDELELIEGPWPQDVLDALEE